MTEERAQMTDTTESPQRRKRRRTRRGSTKSANKPVGIRPNQSTKPCPREGCRGFVKRPEADHCSYLCGVIASELEKVQRICEYLGTAGLTSELWSEAVALSDTWTRYVELDRRIYRAAAAVGISDKQWRAIKEGTKDEPAAHYAPGTSPQEPVADAHR